MIEKIRESLAATQAYLRSGKPLESFEEDHGIRCKTDGQHIICDYHQVRVNWSESFGFVCRGLILDAKTFDVIAMGLNKFFEYDQSQAPTLDWASATYFDKLDGTMGLRWFSPHTGRFETTTRFQLPENIKKNTADRAVLTWENLIEKCYAGSRDLLDQQPKDEVWTLELCSPENHVVVYHNDFYCKLLAARNMTTLQEIPLNQLPGRPDQKPQSYQFESFEAAKAHANSFSGASYEGVVAVAPDFTRVKIHNDDYRRLHKLKEGLNGLASLIILACGGEYDELVKNFPQYKPDLDAVAELINEAIGRHEAVYQEAKDIPVQKDFALEIQKHGLEHTNALFLTRAKKKPNIRTCFLDLDETPFVKIFKERVKTRLGGKYLDEAGA